MPITASNEVQANYIFGGITFKYIHKTKTMFVEHLKTSKPFRISEVHHMHSDTF